MTDDSRLLFDLPAIQRKKVTCDFALGDISSNGGVLLLREVERRYDLAERLANCLPDRRVLGRVLHTHSEMLRLRMLAIAAGYEDADDCDALRHDPVMKIAVGRTPQSGAPLCSQPTMSRLENAPSRTAVARLMRAMLEVFLDSYARPPRQIVLDIDDTVDVVHGSQQLSLFNGHYDERCFLPIHIYEATSGKPVAVILRSGKTLSGEEVRTVLAHLIRRIRSRWPKVAILVRGDSHYGRIEAMDWCDANGIAYIFGLQGNPLLHRLVKTQAERVRQRQASGEADQVRDWCTIQYAAGSWGAPRKVVARLEASSQGPNTRFVVTSLRGSARHLYERVYCARGQAENLIKLHKSQLASDRTSCHSATANQFRLVLHTCAYWLMWGLRMAAPRRSEWARAEFTTLRLRLIKIAARIVETATRVRISLPSSCPDKAIFVWLAVRLYSQPP
jgi:hypothetical protein